ncbi:hypothetical protein PR048_020235 [Dryococelus australis]|uniref:Mutator-like transposase domain-containing protein n=1 Tax=Dryococelus australis TaxID=614101 RepID=A0ABQ9H5U7_9NEOP|nr:hypothetical protein PR048_020235 [Dryococelus australis]
MDFVKEKVDAFHRTWIFTCRVCNIVSVIMSKNREIKDTFMQIKGIAVHSILATEGGFSQLREFSAGVDMNCMSNKTFLKHMKKVSEAIHDAALQSMLNAAEEEIDVAIQDGNVDSDGVSMCTVVFNGASIGFKTQKVLCIGDKNRYCSICASCQNAKQTPPSHMCFLDWKKVRLEWKHIL